MTQDTVDPYDRIAQLEAENETLRQIVVGSAPSSEEPEPEYEGYLGAQEIEHRFGFHKATTEGENATLPVHRDLRLLWREFAMLIDDTLPPGRAKVVAFEHLETASMWTHKAIAETAPLEVEDFANEEPLYDESNLRRVVDVPLPDVKTPPVSTVPVRTMCDMGRPYRDHARRCGPGCDFVPVAP